jgi:phosphatidylglycerol:prolipoprotein diacylglycerol transferase
MGRPASGRPGSKGQPSDRLADVDLASLSSVAVVSWPVLDRIRLGPLAISPHGIGIAVGYLLGSWWFLREGKKRGMAEEHLSALVMWALIGAIVGARGFFVLGHYSEFDGVGDMLAVWRGGISLIGGIVGAVIFGFPVARRRGYRFGQLMDAASIGLAFGIGIGRIGDLVIGDHLGKPTSFLLGFGYGGGSLPGPWALEPNTTTWTATLEDGSIETIARSGARLFSGTGRLVAQGVGVHQTALYDMMIALGLFALLFWLNRRVRREGVLIATFAIWYGMGRLITDFLRVDKTWFGLTGSQWTALAAAVIAIVFLVKWAMQPLPVGAATGGRLDGRVWKRIDLRSTVFTPPREPKEKRD